MYKILDPIDYPHKDSDFKIIKLISNIMRKVLK